MAIILTDVPNRKPADTYDEAFGPTLYRADGSAIYAKQIGDRIYVRLPQRFMARLGSDLKEGAI